MPSLKALSMVKYVPALQYTMKRRTRNLILLLAPLLSPLILFLAYLLMPVGSRRYAITFDNQMIRRKREYLAGLATAENGPNIVLILADDLGISDTSLYGSRGLPTPYIDSIGTGGVTFETAYCTTAVCSPSRAALLTGRYQQRFGAELQMNSRYAANRLEYFVFRNLLDIGFWRVAPLAVPRRADQAKQGLPPSEVSIGEVMKASGYATAAIGKWHLGTAEGMLPSERGFDEHYGFYEAYSLYSPADDEGVVNQRLDEFSDRHQWRQGRRGDSRIHRDGKPIEETGYLTRRIAEEAVAFLDERGNSPFFLFVPFSAPHVPYQAPREYVERLMHIADPVERVYQAMIAALDDAVGSILEALESTCIADDTMVIFASDNGGAFLTGATDNEPYRGGKFTNFEGGMRVPLAIRWPEAIPAGLRLSTPVSLLDLYPTICVAAGIPLPEDRAIDGVDLLPLVRGGSTGVTKGRDALFWRTLYNKAVRSGQWKLVVNGHSSTIRLYDVEADPAEGKDLAASRPDVVSDLLVRLKDWETQMSEPLWPRVMDIEIDIDGELYWFAI